jgi:hypothetical protein
MNHQPQPHPLALVRDLLENAGFVRFRAVQPDEPSLHTLWIAEKPGR